METRGRKVLLLEQNRESKKVVRQALEAEGYTVWEAANGLRLVSRLHVDRPDVVVMDTDEAWTDCFDLCHSLKTSDRFKDVRVVLMAHDAGSDERARSCNCDKLVTGACDIDALLAAISEVLESRSPHDAV